MRDRKLVATNTAGLLFELLDTSLKKVVPAFFGLREEVMAMSKAIEVDAGEIEIDDIMSLGRNAAQLEILFQDQLFCLSELCGGRSESLALETIRAPLANLVAEMERGQTANIRLQDRVRDLYQYHLHHVQEATNRRLNMLTMLSAIYLPPTLIAGIYGMNFENIPIAGIRYGYAIVMGLMVTLVAGQLAFFYSRGWFK